MATFWLSFVKDDTNVGVCIVDADDAKGAHERATVLGINPGGEVLICPCPDDPEMNAEVAALGKNRLIFPSELKRRGYKKESEMGAHEQERLAKSLAEHGATKVCEDCNPGDQTHDTKP